VAPTWYNRSQHPACPRTTTPRNGSRRGRKPSASTPGHRAEHVAQYSLHPGVLRAGGPFKYSRDCVNRSAAPGAVATAVPHGLAHRHDRSAAEECGLAARFGPVGNGPPAGLLFLVGRVVNMDPVSIVVIALVGLVLVWVVYRAFSNSRHDPPTKLRGGQFNGLGGPGGDYGFGEDLNQEAPSGSTARGWRPGSARSGRRDDEKGR
jgi:hypothetical protein